MDELSPRDERGDVLDVVRRWLAGSDPEDDDSNTDGVVAEWERLRGPNPWSSLYDGEHEIEQLEVLEIGAARAVVALRSPHRHTLKRGSNVVEQTLEGPVILEKRDGRWRIVPARTWLAGPRMQVDAAVRRRAELLHLSRPERGPDRGRSEVRRIDLARRVVVLRPGPRRRFTRRSVRPRR